MNPTVHSLLKRDPEFVKQCDKSYADLKTGTIGMVDGVTLKKVPTSYLVANTGYLFIHENTMISPTKFQMARVLTEAQGIDGSVVNTDVTTTHSIPSKKKKV